MAESRTQITGYETSRDYERLADLMQTQSIICITDYAFNMKDGPSHVCRDTAHTLWASHENGESTWAVSARGISYVYAFSRADFIEQCGRGNVEWLEPSAAAASEQ